MALDDNVLANTWEGTWEDRETGRAMAGRGVEVWTMRDGMIAVWDAAFNIWEQGGERKSRCRHRTAPVEEPWPPST
jgi:hypothetical protein